MKAAQQVLDKFNYYYAALYDADGKDDIRHGFYSGFVAAGDEFLAEHPDDAAQLCELRHDLFISDREVAALAMAVADVSFCRKG